MTAAPIPAPSAASGAPSGGPTPAAAGAKKKTAVKASGGAGTKAKKRPAARKKPGSAASSSAGSAPKASASVTNQIYAAARAAQLDLASQRNDAAARRSDPLWYRAEDVLPSVADGTVMAEVHAAVLPEQVAIVESALGKNDLARADVTPQAYACLLEQARRYAMDVLTDSQDYAYVAGRTEIAKADLLLADEMRPDHPMSVSTQVPKLNLLSQTVNRVPLPPIPTHCYSGVVLPPRHHRLTARTYDVVTSAQTAQRMVQAAPTLPSIGVGFGTAGGPKHTGAIGSTAAKAASASKPKPSYGATKGRQIPIQFKDKAAKVGGSGAEGPTPMEISASTDA